MRVLKTAANKVFDVAFSPDNRAVAAAVDSQCVFLWNLDSPTIAPVRLETPEGCRAGSLSFSEDGQQLSWLLLNGQRRYDRPTRTARYEPFAPVAESVYTSHVATCDRDADFVLSEHRLPEYYLAGWNRKDGEWVRQWKLSTRELSISSLTLAPACDRFAMYTRVTAGGRWWEQPMRLEVRDAATGTAVLLGTYPYSYAGRLAFHPGGGQIAGLNDMTLLVWPLPAGGDPRLVRNDNRKHFTALAYHPNGRHLFVTSNDATVHVFDADTLDRVNRYTWQLDRLSAVAVSADGTLAAAGSANGDVVVWDLD